LLAQHLTDSWLRAWLSAFLLTQLIEAPIYLHRHGGGLWRRAGALKALSLALAPTCATHPLIWWPLHAYAHARGWSYLTYALTAEGAVVVAEGWLLWALGARRPLRVALLANALSALAGLALRALGLR